MKRQDYINELKQQLKGLPQSEIADIVRDQEELISDALAAGRTEESILKSLGDPSELARALKAEVIIEQASEEKKLSRQLKGAFGAVGALLLLACSFQAGWWPPHSAVWPFFSREVTCLS